MDCSKAQRLLQQLPSGTLDEAAARHLSECSDCRVAQQRAGRLQQLLSIKRHETPGTRYFDGFLGEFHRRLDDSMIPAPSWWERFLAHVHAESAPLWRHGFAQACGLIFACVMILRGILSSDLPNHTSTTDAAPVGVQNLQASLPPPQSTPHKIASPLPRQPEPTSVVGSALIIPVVSRGELNASRYVLDRISLSPPSYEVASIHF